MPWESWIMGAVGPQAAHIVLGLEDKAGGAAVGLDLPFGGFQVAGDQ